MKTMLASLALMAATSPAAGPAVADPCFERLPFGCSLINSEVLTGRQMDAVGQRLGVPLKKLSNTRLVMQGKPMQINILEAQTDEDARRLHQTISKMKNHPAFCLLNGRKVVEFCDSDAARATKAAYELGFARKPQSMTYRITARIATVRIADYMAFNELCRVFFSTDPRNPPQEAMDRIAVFSKGFTFGESLAMRAPKEKDAASAYRFTPGPTQVETQANDRIVYSFSQPPKVLGVPGVMLTAEIPCDDTGVTPTNRAAEDALLSATSYWPVKDRDVVALATQITAGLRTPEAKVRAILEWLAPGKHIQSAGPSGSRWGVKKVLSQKFGHCWDSSDCFVTLARAAGIPARQVGGWLFGVSGHIWAEVLVAGKGWQQVDPTGGGRLDCGIYHIPYFVSEDGEMPILYVSLPRVEIVETK